MNNYQFTEQMNRLITQFGKSAYSTERVAMVWREVQNLDVASFQTMVDEFVGSARHAPLLPEFREQAAGIREREWSKQKHLSPVHDYNNPNACSHCWDNGTFLCLREDGQAGFWAFRCHCAKGNADPRKKIPQFKSTHSKDYEWFNIRMFSILSAETLA